MARTHTTDKDRTIAALKAKVRALEKELRLTRDPVVHFELGRDRRISNADEALAHITGRRIGKLNGLRLDTVLSPRQGKLDVIFDHFLKGTPYPGPAEPFQTMEINGTGRFFRFSFRPKRDKRGTIRGFRVTGREVTKRLLTKRVEQYHRTGLAIHRTIDRLHLGCLHTYNVTGAQFTPSTLIAGITSRMARSLGYTVKKVPGREHEAKPELYRQSVTRLIAPETVRALNRCLADGTEDWTEGEILAHDGSRRPARFSIIHNVGVWGNSVFIVLISDRSEDEKALRRLNERLVESEEKFRNLFENASDPIFLEDLKGTILDCNRRACELYGYSRKEMLALKLKDLVRKDTFQLVSALREMVARDGHAVVEARNTLRDGSEIDVEVSASTIEIGGRKLVQVICHDITERKRAEEALRASEERYRGIIQDQTELICRFRPDGTLSFVNDAYCRYFDKKPGELIGKSFLPLIPEDDREKVWRVIASLSRENPVGAHEHRVTTPQGEIRWQRWTNRAIHDDQGRLIEYQSVGRDITESRRLAREIRQSEEKYRALVENLNAGLLIIQDGRIRFANRTFQEISGYSAEKLQGKPFDELVSNVDRERIRQRYRAREAGLEVSSATELRAKLADAREITVQAYASLVPYEGRTATQVVLRDVTKQKLLQGQLQRAARLASVGTLAAGVAHEINNPLAVISVDLPRLKRQYKDDPFIAKLCSKLLRMTRRISEITGGLLTFSKATTGVFGKHPLHGPLNRALELMRSRFDFEHKRLIRDFPEKLPTVWCDSDQLQQVFVNLCINALEAVPENGTLTVSAKKNQRDKTVTLRFADTGKGMTAEGIERAFDPFYTTKEAGTGLGLAICHRIVDDHEGQISIRSKPGKGTAVSVVLPVHKPKRPRPQAESRRSGRRKRGASS